VLAAMEARIESLETQLTAKDQQIDQLHHLLAQKGKDVTASDHLDSCRARLIGYHHVQAQETRLS